MSSGTTSPAANGPSSANAAATGSLAHAVTSSLSPAPSTQQLQSPSSGIQTSTSTGVPQQFAPASSQFVAGDPLNTVQYINDPAWPTDLRLDRSSYNWIEWSQRLKLICDRQGFTDWLDVTFPPPDPAAEPRAYRVWTINDRSLKAFILLNISQQDYEEVCNLPDSRTVFAELRKCYEKLGRHTQILLLVKVMKIEFHLSTPLSQTWDEMDTILEKIKAIGPFDHDVFRTAVIIHALGDSYYDNLRLDILSITKQPDFSYDDVVQRIRQEDVLIRIREDRVPPSSTDLVRQAMTRTRPTCSHCKRAGHLADICTQPGGKMEGRSLKDAKAAQRAASQRSSRAGNSSSQSQIVSANVARTENQPSANVSQTSRPLIMINGVAYTLVKRR